jgi:hypothetical protein
MTRPLDENAVRGLAAPTYFVALLLIVISLLDFGATVWPFRLGDVDWRYGTVGLLSGFLLTPLLGVVLVMLVATLLGSRAVVRATAVACLMGAVLGLLALAGFLLDTLQVMRGDEELKTVATVSSGKAAFKVITGVIALAWLGWAGLKGTSVGRQRDQDSIVVGS